MDYGGPNHGPEPLDTRMAMTAHYEAGHIVVAAHCGVGLRSEGIILDREAAGLACYCKELTPLRRERDGGVRRGVCPAWAESNWMKGANRSR